MLGHEANYDKENFMIPLFNFLFILSCLTHAERNESPTCIVLLH